ncbi:MAG: carboxypeptidase-like regulatory domain-containing protein [Acidobacteriota bacterium]|nr:carboxypeptidase-like regulatory domain-containing protein [Acidobacteriota bacterium]
MKLSYRVASSAFAVILGFASVGLAKEPGQLTGHVRSAVSPLATATVYAYQVADATTWKTSTGTNGSFFIDGLPAGLFKIITHKPGFLPSVQVLRRATAHVVQVLEVELQPVSASTDPTASSFWEVREQIPADVLRDIETTIVDLTTSEYDTKSASGAAAAFQAKMAAVAGVQEGLDFGELDVAGAAVGIRGHISDVEIDFAGRFSELAQAASPQVESVDPASGSTQQMSLRVQNTQGKGRSRFDVASRTNRLSTSLDGNPDEVDFEHHRLSWSRAVGRSGRSDVSAQYTSENNYYRQALIGPTGIPSASRSWEVEGTYSGNLTERATIEAGMSYRERESDFSLTDAGYLPRESVELFGRGGVAVKPALVVQYGLYSTLRDGSLSLSPQGGLTLEFGPKWRASTSFSRRIDSEPTDERRRDFVSAYFGDRAPCRQAEEYCYELLLSRLLGDRQTVSFGAVHRKIGETQRLFFSDDFFSRLDSVYLVEGDRLPELNFELTRRLAPAVLARLSSHVASGGGGLFYSTANAPYENNVRYLVTSLDTQFEDTMTGVYLAFHHLEQELEPMGGARMAYHELELERLQLLLRQDLAILSDLANDWAVQLNMELSRGGGGVAGSFLADELRKRVTGGLAVKF